MTDVRLAWMMIELDSMISSDTQPMKVAQEKNLPYWYMHDMPVRFSVMVQFQKSDVGALNNLTGRKVRAVFVRIQQKGPGLANRDDGPGHGVL